MSHLALVLLGPFQATLDGVPVEGLTSDRLRALLAYLAVERGQEHPREQVAALLWPERPDRQALSALRSALSNLHGVLGDRRASSPFLLVTRTTVQFNADSHHWLDVAEFEDLARRPDVVGLERAVSLYRGPFLHGLSLGDSPAFDDWVLLRDEAYRRDALSVLGRLTSLQLSRGDYGEAARWARRQLELEPYREHAHRELMAALALGGERSAALAHYDVCRRLLAQELGCGPEDETQALYIQIRDGSLPQPKPFPVTQSVPTMPVPPPPTAAARPPCRFVAREQELARLGALLDRALAGQGGVALIVGEAGGGKTALLDEFAGQAGQTYGDLIVLRGSCNAYGGAGDPYLPFREMLQTLAGDVEGKRAGGALTAEQAQRLWGALPVVGAALVEHGPDLIDRFVPGEALLRRAEAFPGAAGSARPLGTFRFPQTLSVGTRAEQGWQARLQEIVLGGRAGEGAAPAPGSGLGAPAPATNLGQVPPPDLFAQVTQVLHTVSMHRPLLLAIDDLQWAGGGTAALLFHLGRRLAGSRILLVCAYRPEELGPPSALREAPPSRLGAGAEHGGQAAAPGIEVVIQELQREWGDVLVDLDEADGRAFVEAYVDCEPNHLGAGFRQALYDHTGGNPLFTVELLRSFEREGTLVQDKTGQWIQAAGLDWEQGAAALGGRWPARVEAVIDGHLASLPDEDRVLVQAASVQGELFVAEVAARVLGWSEEAVVRRLSGPLRTRHRLVEAVSLERLAWSGQRVSHYRFRHLLVQRSAYRRLDAVERAWLHETTGRALEAIYDLPAGHAAAGPAAGEIPKVPPHAAAPELAPELARHFAAAGLPLAAARQHLEAGRWAARLVAYDEAIAHLERGLALLERAPASGERLRLELALCLALVNPAMLRRGWRAPAYTRALERLYGLTQHPDLQDDPQRLAALTDLALLTTWSADPVRGGRVGEQLLGLAKAGDPQALMLAHWVLGQSYLLQGRLVAGREHLERALALHDPKAGRHLSPLLEADPTVAGQALLGMALWLLGHPDQARATLRQACARAEQIEQPSGAALAHLVAGISYLIMGRDLAAALNHSQALQPLGAAGLEYGAWAKLLAAPAQAQGGQAPSEASGQGGARAANPALEWCLDQAAEAGSAMQALGSGVGYASQLLVQAGLCAWAGQVEGGVGAMDRALAWIERTGVRDIEAEVWRMRGELLLLAARGATHLVSLDEAEACFRRALEVARGQQARWLELRATVSLARLWQAHGRRQEARELLAGISIWFTEGSDTVDLVEAKALLAELELE